jgi:hypothetical protein
LSVRQRSRARDGDPLRRSLARAREQSWLEEDDLAVLEREAEEEVDRAQRAIEGWSSANPSDALGDISAADLGILE